MLDSGSEGPGFKLQLWRCRVTVLGKLFAHHSSVHQAAKLIAALIRVAGATAGLAESNGSLPLGFMTHATCRLSAKNRDQLWNPTLGNRVWATFFAVTIVVQWMAGQILQLNFQSYCLTVGINSLPAGLPTHLTPLLMRLRFGFADHCARL